MTWAMPPQDAWRVDLLGGFRFLQLRESYTITTSSPYNPPNPADIWNTTDAFDARNRFYGLQVGARAAYDQGPWVGSVIGKLALGTMQQRVSVNGSLETNDYNNYGPTQIFSGAYFALPTNSGDHSRNTFAVVPEIALNLGYRLTPQATVYVGYSFLYASNVARPGRPDQPQHQSDPDGGLRQRSAGHARRPGATHLQLQHDRFLGADPFHRLGVSLLAQKSRPNRPRGPHRADSRGLA